MIRSILVALDNTEPSKVARHFAVRMAKRRKALVTGIAILDQAWLTAPEAVPIGGAAFKADLDQHVMNDIKKKIKVVEKEFKETCEKNKVNYEIVDAIGKPLPELSRHLVNHDLLVLGDDTDFHFMGGMGTSAIVKELLNQNPRPVIITNTSDESGKDIIVAYDGSIGSSRAIHLAILLGIFKFTTPHIITVASSKKEAGETMRKAVSLFERHGLQPKIHPIESTSRPSEEILKLADKLDTALVVMGSYGHKGLQSLLLGSCTNELLKKSQYPFFMCH